MSTLHLRAQKVGLDAILATGTLKLSFMTTAFTPNASTHQYYSDVIASVASGTTPVTLSGITTTIDTPNSRVELDSNDPTLAGVTTSTNKYVLWVDTDNNATSLVLATVNLASTLTPTSGQLTVTVNAEGHFALKST